MCGRYAQYAPIQLTEEEESALHDLNAELDLAGVLNQREPRFNICPTQTAPVIARGEAGIEVKGLRWGLVPGWAQNIKIGTHAINARQESVEVKPMFRAAFKKRRALVPASGFFEWTGEKGHKQPWIIYPPDHTLMLFAGLWEAWKDTTDPAAEWIKTFTILTGLPGKVSGDIHDRQPVILPPTMWETWLDGTPEEAASLLEAVPEAELVYHPVTKAVSSPKSQGRQLIEPITL
jgi:putative SOS response-associated peptidase YedK